MHTKTLQHYFLAALIIISFILIFFIFRPFLMALALAAVFAVILYPLYTRILHRMRSAPGLAACATILLSVVCLLVPLTFITIEITSQAKHVYATLTDGSGGTYLNTVLQYANDAVMQYAPSLAPSSADLATSIDQYTQDGLAWLIQNLGGAFGGAARALLSFFVFLIALYYLLRDGARIRQTIIDMSPLADTEDDAVLKRLELAIHSVIQGSLVIALIQGTLTGIGFAVFGIPNSILWGVVATLAALIPGIGTALVLAPGVAYLFIIGSTTAGMGLLIWSVVAVGLIDNFLGPKLVGKGMQLHPLAVLLAVFGGLALFGPAGIFLGPLCVSFLFALLSIYTRIKRQAV